MCYSYCLERLYTGKPVYEAKAIAFDIVSGGWSRDFKVCQIETDLVLSGFKVATFNVKQALECLKEAYDALYQGDELSYKLAINRARAFCA